MFTTLRSLTLLLLFGVLSGTPTMADPLILPKSQLVTAVIRCNTRALAEEIVAAYSISALAGNGAVEARYDQITEYGQRLCNPVQSFPLFISQIELLSEPTTVMSSDGEVSSMQVAEVRLGLSPEETDDVGFLIISGSFAEVIVGEAM